MNYLIQKLEQIEELFSDRPALVVILFIVGIFICSAICWGMSIAFGALAVLLAIILLAYAIAKFP